MKICIARLRERVRYTKPLEYVSDCFYPLLNSYIRRHSEHRYFYYNISFDGSRPVRDVGQVRQAEVIIIPTEHEFHYHVPGYFHSNQMKSHEHVAKLCPYIEGKRVILLSSDRADDEALYHQYTFKGSDFDCHLIDEMDFSGGVQGMRFEQIVEFLGSRQDTFFPVSEEKTLDFVYWGSLKNKGPGGRDYGDCRHLVLKQISKSDLNCMWVGRYIGVKRHFKMGKMIDIIPNLAPASSTLCFNWLDKRAVTARYHEAMAMKMVPFVWQDYDCDGILVKNDWQRVRTSGELVEKAKSLRDENFRTSTFDRILSYYLKDKKSHSYYYKRFDSLLNRKLR